MIATEIYRIRIGLNYSRQAKIKGIKHLNYFELLIIMSLLLIAGVERNPGPASEIGKSNFSEQFRKFINCYKRIGYCLDIMRQTACLVVNPIIVDGYASLFNCTTAVRASDSVTASS